MGGGDLDEAGREDDQDPEGARLPRRSSAAAADSSPRCTRSTWREIRLGESVAVLGVGPVGQSCVAFASLSGAGEIIAVGAPKDRLDVREANGRDARRSDLDLRPEARLDGDSRTHRRTRRRRRDRSERTRRTR